MVKVPAFLAALLSALALLSVAGCCTGVQCDMCPPAVFISAADADTGAPIQAFSISGYTDSACNQSCMIGYQPGTYTVTVSAPGYVSQTLTIDVPEGGEGCCSCGFDGVSRTAKLVKA